MKTRCGWSMSRGLLVRYRLVRIDSIKSLRRTLDSKCKVFAVGRDGTFMGLVVAVQVGGRLDGQLVIDTGDEPIWMPIDDPRVGSIISRDTGEVELPETEEV